MHMHFADQQACANWDTDGGWRDFADHRQQVMALIAASRRRTAGTVCVLGAGNCNDLDLPELARLFKRVDLVDVDPDAVARGLHRQGVARLPQIVTHAPVDVTDVLHHLPASGQLPQSGLPDMFIERLRSSLIPFLLPRFDLVISTGLLTQLYQSVVESSFDPEATVRLILALRAHHLRLISDLTADDGVSVLVTELVSSDSLPELVDPALDPVVLMRRIPELIESRNFFTGANPQRILQTLLEDPRCVGVSGSVQLSSPWVWRISTTRAYLAFAVIWWRHPVSPPHAADPRESSRGEPH